VPVDEKGAGVLTVRSMWSLGGAMLRKVLLVEPKKVWLLKTLLLPLLQHNEWVVGWRVRVEVLVLATSLLSEYWPLVAA